MERGRVLTVTLRLDTGRKGLCRVVSGMRESAHTRFELLTRYLQLVTFLDHYDVMRRFPWISLVLRRRQGPSRFVGKEKNRTRDWMCSRIACVMFLLGCVKTTRKTTPTRTFDLLLSAHRLPRLGLLDHQYCVECGTRRCSHELLLVRLT
jgi:hypothetical protein